MAYHQNGDTWIHTCDGSKAIEARNNADKYALAIWHIESNKWFCKFVDNGNEDNYLCGLEILFCPYCGERLEVPEEITKG